MIEDITFLGQTLETAPCFREDILSVAETVAMSDPSVMEMVVCELDSSSQFYSETTAREHCGDSQCRLRPHRARRLGG